MKKFLSIVLALAMVFALSVTAFAYDSVTQSENQTVSATYSAPGAGTVTNAYYFTISWGSVTAADYTGEKINYTWNPSTMTYASAGDDSAAWTAGSVSVTITSKSDKGLTVTPRVAYASGYNGASTMKVDGTDVSTVSLESAARTSADAAMTATAVGDIATFDHGTAQSKTIDFTITPSTAIDADVATIATVTVQVAAAS